MTTDYHSTALGKVGSVAAQEMELLDIDRCDGE